MLSRSADVSRGLSQLCPFPVIPATVLMNVCGTKQLYYNSKSGVKVASPPNIFNVVLISSKDYAGFLGLGQWIFNSDISYFHVLL